MAELRVAVPRLRAHPGPAILAYGFRPFFLAAAVWAVVSLALWLAFLEGAPVVASAFDPLLWHAHEMIFGFVGAAITGFLLTAIPNWTGRMPLQGWPLLGLVSLWLAGRIVVAVSASIGAAPAAVIDLVFYAAVLAVVVREVIAGKNWRNLIMVAAVATFLAANALMHAEAMGLAETAQLGWRLGVSVAVMLIALIGGRIIPSFTRNWLAKREAPRLPAPFRGIDRATLIVTLVALIAWTLSPESPVTAVLASVAAIANLVRLARWEGHATWAEPLVLILHLGYAWIWIGFALLAAGIFSPAVPPIVAVHAFSAGAMATMIMAVMTRATLGHTGRTLHAGAATSILYVLVTAAAILRVAASLLPAFYHPLLMTSGLAWLAAFLGYAAVYGPMLLRPRPDGKPG
ncbi:MAG: NnrS family protein [Rhodospirillales bacterium]|nr:NnrS family protein [Rhodospirillales bacterium]